MRILDQYIRRTIFVTTFYVSAVIIGIDTFLTLMQQFRLVGTGHYDMTQAFLFVPMQLPAQFYQLFPMVGFLGSMIGLIRLSSTSQLIVMRASGVSIVRIAWSVMKAAIIMIIVVTLLGEGLGPLWQQKAALIKQNDLAPIDQTTLLQSIWLHEGNSFTYIGSLDNKQSMTNIIRYHFTPNNRLTQVTVAKSAKRINKHWELTDLQHTIFQQNQVIAEYQRRGVLNVVFKPVLHIQMKIVSAQQSIAKLYHTIQYRRLIGLSVNQFIFNFWQRVLQPITTLVMIGLAVPFVFGSFRASMGVRIMMGVLIGFAFYMLNQLFGPITLVYQFPPLYAAIIPTCVFLLVGILLLLRVK